MKLLFQEGGRGALGVCKFFKCQSQELKEGKVKVGYYISVLYQIGVCSSCSRTYSPVLSRPQSSVRPCQWTGPVLVSSRDGSGLRGAEAEAGVGKEGRRGARSLTKVPAGRDWWSCSPVFSFVCWAAPVQPVNGRGFRDVVVITPQAPGRGPFHRPYPALRRASDAPAPRVPALPAGRPSAAPPRLPRRDGTGKDAELGSEGGGASPSRKSSSSGPSTDQNKRLPLPRGTPTTTKKKKKLGVDPLFYSVSVTPLALSPFPAPSSAPGSGSPRSQSPTRPPTPPRPRASQRALADTLVAVEALPPPRRRLDDVAGRRVRGEPGPGGAS